MRISAACILVCVLALVLMTSAPATAAPRTTAIEVSLSREQVETRLGESFTFEATVTNTGSTTLSGLVAHLNVVGLSEGIYVDPEDWSEERTKDVASIPPGGSATLSWSVEAVTGGDAAIYVVVLPGKSPATAPEGLAVSPALDVRITERRTLNSGGVLPLALGVPALLGIVTLVARRRRRA